MIEPILINLNDYVRTGEGANGASYNHKSDPGIMMKLYLRNFESARTELEMAKKVYELGIPSPEPGDLVTTESAWVSVSVVLTVRNPIHVPAVTTPNTRRSMPASSHRCASRCTTPMWTRSSSRT